MTMARPPIQLAYVVRDVAAAAGRWTELTGAGPFFLADFRIAGQTYREAPAEVNVRVALGYLGDMMLELVEPLDDRPSVFNEVLQSRGEGPHHWLVHSDDFDGDIRRYADKGCSLAAIGPIPGFGRAAMFDTMQALGAFTEIVELSPSARAMWDYMRRAHATWDGHEPLRSFPTQS